VESAGIAFPILYNPQADVVKQYGVFGQVDPRLATPSTFIIDKQGVIRWKYVGKSVADEPPASVVLEQLRQLK